MYLVKSLHSVSKRTVEAQQMTVRSSSGSTSKGASMSQGEERVYAEGLHCGRLKGKPGEARYCNPTTFFFVCLYLLSSPVSCVYLIQYRLAGVRLVTMWHFRGQAFKAGTSILSIRDFTPRLLITLLHSIWRPESEGADAQFRLRIVLGCDRRESPARAVCCHTFCWIEEWLMPRGYKLSWLGRKTNQNFVIFVFHVAP